MSKNSHAVAWAPDAPTPAQLKELFAQINAGRITKRNVQDLLRRSTVLRPISYPESIVEIDAVDGTETIADAGKRVFSSIEEDFWKRCEFWGPALIRATEKTMVRVYVLAKDASLAEMFKSLSDDLNRVCFTQHQIINFVEKYTGSFNRRILFLLETSAGRFDTVMVHRLEKNKMGLSIHFSYADFSLPHWGANEYCLVAPIG